MPADRLDPRDSTDVTDPTDPHDPVDLLDPADPDPALSARVQAVRRFNRFYTRQLGLLREGLLKSPYSLSEARVIYELAQHDGVTAAQLSVELGMDPGYLSRMLRGFRKAGLIERTRSEADRRRRHLSLTEAGREAFAVLDAASRAEIEAVLSARPKEDQARVVAAMERIEAVLGTAAEPRPAYVLRPPRSGDFGWVVERHGVLYAREYGWNEAFEGLVAEIVGRYVRELDPERERCWIAERNGREVGSVFLVRHPEREGVAKLRLLLVEPEARGLGIGRRLVRECSGFAREAGYRGITLWTNSVLTAARAIYEGEGYVLVQSEAHHSFGHDLVSETWEMSL